MASIKITQHWLQSRYYELKGSHLAANLVYGVWIRQMGTIVQNVVKPWVLQNSRMLWVSRFNKILKLLYSDDMFAEWKTRHGLLFEYVQRVESFGFTEKTGWKLKFLFSAFFNWEHGVSFHLFRDGFWRNFSVLTKWNRDFLTRCTCQTARNFNISRRTIEAWGTSLFGRRRPGLSTWSHGEFCAQTGRRRYRRFPGNRKSSFRNC